MWKKAAGKDGRFMKHQNSNCHKEAVTKFSETTTTKDIGTVISNEYLEKEAQNRKCLMIVIEHIRLLARQGLPIRGDQSGEKSGVKTQIISDNEKALYIHCLNHGLNLAVMDTLSQINLFKNSLSYSEELLILFKKSPKREHLFKDIKDSTFDESPGLKSFSRTR